jgi:hypothetical protein
LTAAPVRFGSGAILAAAFQLPVFLALVLILSTGLTPPAVASAAGPPALGEGLQTAGQGAPLVATRGGTGVARAWQRLIAPKRVCPRESDLAGRSRAIRTMVGLKRSASRKAADILRCDAFSHTACGRSSIWWISREYSRRCLWASENIAWGPRWVSGVRQIFKVWVKSPPHLSAILSRRYNEIGIGFQTGEFNGRPTARVWVQHFARLC